MCIKLAREHMRSTPALDGNDTIIARPPFYLGAVGEREAARSVIRFAIRSPFQHRFDIKMGGSTFYHVPP